MTAFTLSDFVSESNRIEGICRPPLADEIDIHKRLLVLKRISVEDLEDFVNVVQPGAALRRARGMNVRVGDHVAPSGGPEIVHRLEEFLKISHHPSSSVRRAGAFRVHCQYETLHPFTDGNGRSGRALWLWMMGGVERAPLGFLHHFYYQTLGSLDERTMRTDG